MKFSLAATALCALSSTSAAAAIEPRAVPAVAEPRAVTVVGTIDASVNAVANALPAYLSTLGKLLLKESPKAMAVRKGGNLN